jgi:hypothetical protein
MITDGARMSPSTCALERTSTRCAAAMLPDALPSTVSCSTSMLALTTPLGSITR